MFISWNSFKRRYDVCVVLGIVLFLAAFVATSFALAEPGNTPRPEAVIVRALGACAIAMLHAVLWIGPLARLNSRFLAALYNRRHLGVLTFLVGLAHAVASLGYYHGFGIVNPFVSLARFSPGVVPFEWLGVAALVILFSLAATSHDFWNRTLGPVGWKALHISIYFAYALLVGHVLLGSATEQPLLRITILIAAAITCTLHLVAGVREVYRARPAHERPEPGWIDAGTTSAIAEGTARNVNLKGGHAVAVCKHKGEVYAIGGRCVHQGGPLAEGRIIDGCLTCPWHGWQYVPATGASPPPFQEQLPVYQVRIVGDRIHLREQAGTAP